MLQNLILRTRSYGTGFITQPSCILDFHLTESVRWKWFVLAVYQFWKGISAGPALKYFTRFIGAGGVWHRGSHITHMICAFSVLWECVLWECVLWVRTFHMICAPYRLSHCIALCAHGHQVSCLVLVHRTHSHRTHSHRTHSHLCAQGHQVSCLLQMTPWCAWHTRLWVCRFEMCVCGIHTSIYHTSTHISNRHTHRRTHIYLPHIYLDVHTYTHLSTTHLSRCVYTTYISVRR